MTTSGGSASIASMSDTASLLNQLRELLSEAYRIGYIDGQRTDYYDSTKAEALLDTAE